MNVPELAYSLLAQANFIQLTLRSLGVAHCDIKPDNLIVCNAAEGVRLFLIDMDDAIGFGGAREVGTFESNMSRDLCDLGDPVTENTDDLGFHFVKNFIFIPWD
jgi:serine/threonine protein kinase